MKLLFNVECRLNAQKNILFAIQPKLAQLVVISRLLDILTVYDRHGNVYDEIQTIGQPCAVQWHPSGDSLVILDEESDSIVIWSVDKKSTKVIKANFTVKDVFTAVAWSTRSRILALGTQKGNVLFYYQQFSKLVPVIGVHSKKITEALFTDDDQLILCSDDCSITVLNSEGDLLFSYVCSGVPSLLNFTERRVLESKEIGNGTISVVISKDTLLLLDFPNFKATHKINFNEAYGEILHCTWFDDKSIIFGFQKGQTVLMSVRQSTMGQELFSIQDFQNYFCGLFVNSISNKVIVAGDFSIKLREKSRLADVKAVLNLESNEKRLQKLSCSDDGQILVFSTDAACVHVYLIHLISLWATSGNKLAYLSSLSEITVRTQFPKENIVMYEVKIEPSIIAVGFEYFAIGINNKVLYYKMRQKACELLTETDYLGTVKMILLNSEKAFVLCDGKLIIHPVGHSMVTEQNCLIFPKFGNKERINCISLSADYVAYATDTGLMVLLFFDSFEPLTVLKHSIGIDLIATQRKGVKALFVTEKINIFAFDPITSEILEVNAKLEECKSLCWEQCSVEKDVFLVADHLQMKIFKYMKSAINETRIELLHCIALDAQESVPVLCSQGSVVILSGSDLQERVITTNYKYEGQLENFPIELKTACQILHANKDVQSVLKNDEKKTEAELWEIVAKAALEELHIELGNICYQHIGDISMVWCLKDISCCENRDQLRAHVAMIMQNYALAEKLYIDSFNFKDALQMYCDIMDWENALRLADQFFPEQIANISKEFAQELEQIGQYEKALHYYRSGLTEAQKDNDSLLEKEQIIICCKNGIARTSLWCGEVKEGIKLALQSSDDLLLNECASILEQKMLFNEAADMYARCEEYNKSAYLWLKSKNWSKLKNILHQVTAKQFYVQYAKAMETIKDYSTAAESYKKGDDYFNFVRISMEHLNGLEEAVRVVQESKCIEAAKFLSNYFIGRNDYSSAVRLLVLANCFSEALQLAKKKDKMEVFADTIGDDGDEEIYNTMASYFDHQGKKLLAGKFYMKAEKYHKAFDIFINDQCDKISIKLAVECAALTRDRTIIDELLQFLTGEKDGIPKDPTYLFQLYTILERHQEAAKIAIIIVKDKQSRGQYRLARDVLFKLHQSLIQKHLPISLEMKTALMLLHSYLLVKVKDYCIDLMNNSSVRRKLHPLAARLLIRIAENINDFAMHAVQIYTLTAIECWYSGMKSTAYKWAAVLMRPNYKESIDSRYKKTIETIIRRVENIVFVVLVKILNSIIRKREDTDDSEMKTPCPYCKAQLAESELKCTCCKNTIPFCIASFKHISDSEITVCVHCGFPAISAEYKKWIAAEKCCPMCGTTASVDSIQILPNGSAFINSSYTNDTDRRSNTT
ncbi:WD repeat-containing protein 19 [Trichinella pseudospiralis]|uniref:WD repeat-containing protein 19 n=1 Tax=Trichinella pseudospiralis TaxID=6337 RepID=A0A0V1K8Z9_TRIPS|nr:WD repeat-containing protein 19 [Trichinella pseudospiralis]